MKLRIKGNSVRLRLSAGEVSKLVNQGEVFESAHIVDQALVYGLKLDNKEEMTASFLQNRIIVTLPKSMVIEWDKNGTVGFEAQTDQGLKILVEKDFQCLDERDEDESDLYPNPNK